MPKNRFRGTMLIFWAIPMEATTSEPKEAAKLFSRVMLVTFSRFWIQAGIPTANMPRRMVLSKENIFGDTDT